MKLRLLICVISAVSLLSAACGGPSESESAPATPSTTGATSTPTSEPGVASGPVALGQSLLSSDGRLEIGGTGRTALDVNIREAKSPPAAPHGWLLVTPVYDITAREPGRSALVTQLKDPFELRFKSAEPLATIMSYDGDSWEMVRSDAVNGVVEARVDHLTPYAVARPSNAILGAATPSTARPASTITPQPTTPPVGGATAPAGTRRPGVTATATVATVSPELARTALEASVSRYKGRTTSVQRASGYTGSGYLSLPPRLTAALLEADMFGEMYHGQYDGVNEAFTIAVATGAADRSFTLLIEPKIDFPSSSTRAQELLAGYFPGAAGLGYAAVQSGPAAYTYQASNGTAFFVLGFVQLDGVPIAFLSTGSGVFTSSAVSVK